MNGGIVFRNGGSIGWLGEHQEWTSLSSCVAKIWPTNATLKKVVDFLLAQFSDENGHTLNNISTPTILYNNNCTCVKWLHNLTSKAAHHIKPCKHSVCKWVQDNTLNVVHVAGKVNPANIFTKEMKKW
jgi:hypothetical protein